MGVTTIQTTMTTVTIQPIKMLFVFLPLVLVILIGSADGTDDGTLFNQWKARFNKTYANNGEHDFRFAIWKANHERIGEHNSRHDLSHSFEMGHNQFSDMTVDEIRTAIGGGLNRRSRQRKPVTDTSTTHRRTSSKRSLRHAGTVSGSSVPSSVDWVEAGAVSLVKNQWFCGSCWAFSGVGAVEGAHAIATGNVVSLSVQQILDCDLDAGGCQGSMPEDVYAYDTNTTGLCTDKDFRYGARRHKDPMSYCKKQRSNCKPVMETGVASVAYVDATNQDMMEAVTIQPVSVTIQSLEHDFLFYKSGVYDGKCGNKADHAVLVVGYTVHDPKDRKGNTDGTVPPEADYWLVKNSWGRHWGEQGYVRMGLNREEDGGMCGILIEGNRPILAIEKATTGTIATTTILDAVQQ